MAYGLDDAIDSITEHPYIAAGGVIVLLFLMTRGGGGNATAAADYTASLQSMQIASETNVALAGIQAQRDAAALAAKRDIILGAQQYAQSDRAANVAIATQALTESSNTTALVNSNALAAFQSALGFTAAFKDLQNQSDALNFNYDLGVKSAQNNTRLTDNAQILGLASINADRTVNMASISSARDLGIAGINADIDLSKYAIGANVDLEKFIAPFTERMHQSDNDTIEQLAHVSYKTAKVTSKPGLFSSILGGITSALSAGSGLTANFMGK